MERRPALLKGSILRAPNWKTGKQCSRLGQGGTLNKIKTRQNAFETQTASPRVPAESKMGEERAERQRSSRGGGGGGEENSVASTFGVLGDFCCPASRLGLDWGKVKVTGGWRESRKREWVATFLSSPEPAGTSFKMSKHQQTYL